MALDVREVQTTTANVAGRTAKMPLPLLQHRNETHFRVNLTTQPRKGKIMKIGTGIAIAGIWLGVGIACLTDPIAAAGFLPAMIATIIIAIATCNLSKTE